jgi:hypothetical protein
MKKATLQSSGLISEESGGYIEERRRRVEDRRDQTRQPRGKKSQNRETISSGMYNNRVLKKTRNCDFDPDSSLRPVHHAVQGCAQNDSKEDFFNSLLGCEHAIHFLAFFPSLSNPSD